MRRWTSIVGALAITAAIAIGIVQSDGGKSERKGSLLTPAQAHAKLKGSAPKLAAIHSQANEILPGGKSAYQRRVKSLRGLPVVVNGWGSWCVPCRQEMPVFNQVSANLGTKVAFLGVNSEDSLDGANAFLKKTPVSYPSYEDGKGTLISSFGIAGLPATIFYDRKGHQFVHQGPYRSQQDLITDIKRYALTG
jgi:cytochrome c biogenesis protein CcmG/thiol:disulfide interchange protein DsbE